MLSVNVSIIIIAIHLGMTWPMKMLLLEGQYRMDVNVSLAKDGSRSLGVRTEIKNLSSFRSVYAAINSELNRQFEVLENGGVIVKETRTIDSSGLVNYVFLLKVYLKMELDEFF